MVVLLGVVMMSEVVGEVVSMVKSLIGNCSDSLLALSVTEIAQSVYVSSARVLRVMVFVPTVALVVDEEQEP